MSAIRVLIIDDSVVVRRFVSNALAMEPDIEVVGTASNGRLGIAKISQLSPDIIVLDLEMPEMDGLATLEEIRKQWPRMPVIMYSSLTQRGGLATLDALDRGANDYVTKPAKIESPAAAEALIRSQLAPKIRALVPRIITPATYRRNTSDPARIGSVASLARPRSAVPTAIEIVAIGTSTGGPNALAALIPSIPADFPAPIVIVQHMPPLFTAMLADRLESKSAIRVREAKHGDCLVPGHAWIAPGDHHMIVTRTGGQVSLQLHQGPQENSCRPSVDVLFSSVAATYGSGTLAIVLTGMGNDGMRGCEKIREAGGSIFVQDEASSVVWGMPGFVARAGLADRVLPLEEIGLALVGRVRQPQPTGGAA
jgi:two-component system chemotaxis response regulator CheB